MCRLPWILIRVCFTQGLTIRESWCVLMLSLFLRTYVFPRCLYLIHKYIKTSKWFSNLKLSASIVYIKNRKNLSNYKITEFILNIVQRRNFEYQIPHPKYKTYKYRHISPYKVLFCSTWFTLIHEIHIYKKKRKKNRTNKIIKRKKGKLGNLKEWNWFYCKFDKKNMYNSKKKKKKKRPLKL